MDKHNKDHKKKSSETKKSDVKHAQGKESGNNPKKADAKKG